MSHAGNTGAGETPERLCVEACGESAAVLAVEAHLEYSSIDGPAPVSSAEEGLEYS